MRVLATVLAIAAGLIVLVGYFYPVEPLLGLRLQLMNWAMVIGAMAVLVGIVNLVSVQTEKLRMRQKSAGYSGILVLSLIITFGFALVYGPDDPVGATVNAVIVNAVIMPVEASLMAILAVTLIYASIRLFRRRVDLMSIVFLVVAVISLIVIIPTPFGSAPGDLIRQSVGVISNGGARGLLIGVALGTLLTGLRVIFGVDRPYGGN